MTESLLRKLVHNFPENGPKLLLENAANVRDLLVLVGDDKVERIDFTAMSVERTHFVQPDYEHVSLDLLFKAPFRMSAGKAPRTILIYLLVEHQSRPQRFFMLRLAEYLLETYKMQKRAWDERHDSDAKLMLQPVLPMVLYTGARRWERIDALADVIEAGELFAEAIPHFQPHFLNLRDTAPAILRQGGFFGQVLWLLQQRHGDAAAFRQTLEAVVSALEKMSTQERQRWVEFLSYILALVYHARREEEHQQLREVVERTVQSDPHRKEYTNMGRTIAEMFKDEGRVEEALDARRTILIRLLRKRFKKLPRKMESRILATSNLHDLETWLDNVLDAGTLAEVGIPQD